MENGKIGVSELRNP